ncbi:MAG: hypothetical protein HGA22_13650, partial [Clostridiales bacterium]|nr:hypothetical protein [Clostridiales bacterium]
MKSIRSRLLLYMTVSIGMFALLLFGLNTFFAEKYYTEQKKAMLVKSCESVLALVEGLDTRSDFEDSVLDDEIRKIEESTGVTLAIGTKDGKQYYPSIKISGGPQKPAQTIFTPYTRFGKPMTVINKPGPDPKTPSAAANPNVTVPGENPAPPSAATTPKTDTAEDSTTGHEKTAYFITVNDSRLNIDT